MFIMRCSHSCPQQSSGTFLSGCKLFSQHFSNPVLARLQASELHCPRITPCPCCFLHSRDFACCCLLLPSACALQHSPGCTSDAQECKLAPQPFCLALASASIPELPEHACLCMWLLASFPSPGRTCCGT